MFLYIPSLPESAFGAKVPREICQNQITQRSIRYRLLFLKGEFSAMETVQSVNDVFHDFKDGFGMYLQIQGHKFK